MKKKGMLYLGIAVLVFMLVVVFTSLGNNKLVTGNKDKLTGVMIVIEPYHTGRNDTILIEDSETMHLLYDLAETSETRTQRITDREHHMVHDAKYQLVFQYNSAEEIITATENREYFYRDTGLGPFKWKYVMGSENGLIAFIQTLDQENIDEDQ